MPASLIDAESLLAVDVGTCNTRASLFDMVEGYYRFIASGQASTTAAAPFKDISEGVRRAIENLQSVTGRTLLNAENRLIMPSQPDGTGVDSFAATLSAGPAIKTAVAGLLEDVSLKSVQRLARSTYARIVETISLNDRRKPEEQIDSLLRLNPDLILVAGGTDGGASRSVQKILEIIGLACYLMPAEKRPSMLFAGNQKIAAGVMSSLEGLLTNLRVSPNIRPSLDMENLQPAEKELTNLFAETRRGQMAGVDELNAWAGGNLLPTAHAEGRIIRFLSQVSDSRKGLLGVDIGASATTLAAAFGGELIMGVYPQFGLGEGIAGLLRYTTPEDILRWLPNDLPADAVRDYLYQKSIYPTSLPATVEDLAIEQAIARQSLHLALSAVNKDFPYDIARPAMGLTPYFEPILAGGSIFTHAPTWGQSLLILLDGIQPTGSTTLVLDQNNLLPALGAAATRNSILPVQVLESGAFLGLATVVAPVSGVRHGTPVLSLRLIYQSGNETRLDVRQGTLEVLPLPVGQAGRLYLQPLQRADVGFGPGRSGEIPVSGTALGVVIDARGRPLRLPADPVRRREVIKTWLWTVGG